MTTPASKHGEFMRPSPLQKFRQPGSGRKSSAYPQRTDLRWLCSTLALRSILAASLDGAAIVAVGTDREPSGAAHCEVQARLHWCDIFTR